MEARRVAERRQAPLTLSSWALDLEVHGIMEKLGHLLEPTISITLLAPALARTLGGPS